MSTEPPAVQMVTAGYVVVSQTRRPIGFDAGVPDPFLTISQCLADGLHVPEFYGWYQDLQQAREALGGADSGSLLVVVGMTPQDAVELIREMPDEPWHFQLVHAGSVAPQEARWLGFEVVGAEINLGLHSWHCHGYAPEAESALGIPLTQDGLLATYEEAVRVRKWMLTMPADEQPAPVPWAVVHLGVLGQA